MPIIAATNCMPLTALSPYGQRRSPLLDGARSAATAAVGAVHLGEHFALAQAAQGPLNACVSLSLLGPCWGEQIGEQI